MKVRAEVRMSLPNVLVKIRLNMSHPENVSIDFNRDAYLPHGTVSDNSNTLTIGVPIERTRVKVILDDERGIDLSRWNYYYAHRIHIVARYDIDPSKGIRLNGIENYHNLRVLKYARWVSSGINQVYTLNCLDGLEFCHLLDDLIIIGQDVSDLTPISSLPLRRLSVAFCPLTSLEPVNTKKLEVLSIDFDQVHLINEDMDFSSIQVIEVIARSKFPCWVRRERDEFCESLFQTPELQRVKAMFPLLTETSYIVCGKSSAGTHIFKSGDLVSVTFKREPLWRFSAY